MGLVCGGQNKNPAPRGRGASKTYCRKQDLNDPGEPNELVASGEGRGGIVRLTAHGVYTPLAPTAGIATNYSGRAACRILFCGLLLCPPRSLLTRLALYVNGWVSARGGVTCYFLVVFCYWASVCGLHFSVPRRHSGVLTGPAAVRSLSSSPARYQVLGQLYQQALPLCFLWSERFMWFVQQTLDAIAERLLLWHRVVEHLAKAGWGRGWGGVQERPLVEHLLTFHRAGSSDKLRDGAGVPRLFHLRWCGFVRAVATVVSMLWTDGWETVGGRVLQRHFAPGQSGL